MVAALEAHPGTTALVGDRIYPLQAPQETPLPFVVYQKISGGLLHTLQRTLPLVGPRLQIDSWAETYTTAKTVSINVRQALDGVLAWVVGERDLLSTDGRRYRVSQDFAVWIDEEV